MGLFGIGGRGPQARLGLDIGTRFIKLVGLNPTAQGVQLQQFGVCATPVGAVTDGVLNNPEAVGEAIAQLIKYYNVKEKRVVMSLPGRAVVVRSVALPAALNDKEIKVVTIGEVERFLPYPLEDMEYDFKQLGKFTKGESEQMSVVFIAAPREVVQKRVEAARMGGLDSIEMDIDPFVIMRSVFEYGMFEDQGTFQQTVMLIEIGASSTSVSVVAAGSLRFTRIFATGGDNLTRAIESGRDITFLEAEKLKKEKGVAMVDDRDEKLDDEARELHGMLRPHLDNLTLEIRRSLAYYTSKYRGEAVNKILLTGGGAMLRGLRPLLEEDLEIPVVFANPLRGMSYVGDLDVATVAAKAPFMGIASGLALRQVPPKQLQRYTSAVDVETGYEFGAAAVTGGVS